MVVCGHTDGLGMSRTESATRLPSISGVPGTARAIHRHLFTVMRMLLIVNAIVTFFHFID